MADAVRAVAETDDARATGREAETGGETFDPPDPVAAVACEANLEVIDVYVGEHPHELGDITLEWEAGGGEVLVRMTGDVDAHERALRAAVPHPKRLRVERAVRSNDELEDLIRRIADDHVALLEEGIEIDLLGADHEHGLVLVDLVAADEAAARACLFERYGNDVAVHVRTTAAELVAVAWQLFTERDGLLKVHYATDAVHELDRAELEEDAEEVRITVIEAQPTALRTPMHTTRSASVQLASPLGDRRVVDSVSGAIRSRWGG